MRLLKLLVLCVVLPVSACSGNTTTMPPPPQFSSDGTCYNAADLSVIRVRMLQQELAVATLQCQTAGGRRVFESTYASFLSKYTGEFSANFQSLRQIAGRKRFNVDAMVTEFANRTARRAPTDHEFCRRHLRALEWALDAKTTSIALVPPPYDLGPEMNLVPCHAGPSGNDYEAAPNPASAPPPQHSTSGSSIPMKKHGGTYVVPVLINNAITLDFTVDSGASDVTIPEDVVSTLIRTGTIKATDFIGEQTYVLADGSRVRSKTFRIRSLRVGDRVLENVTGSVAGRNGSLLLGQSFLGRFKSWSIDNSKHALVLE